MLWNVRAGIEQGSLTEDEKSQRFSLVHLTHQEIDEEEEQAAAAAGVVDNQGAEGEEADAEEEEEEEENYGSSILSEPLYLSTLAHKFAEKNKLGSISFGEVSLNSLKSKLGNMGKSIDVEYKLGASGATLICSNQLAVWKVNENDFLVEGAPGALFNNARDVVYSNFVRNKQQQQQEEL